MKPEQRQEPQGARHRHRQARIIGTVGDYLSTARGNHQHRPGWVRTQPASLFDVNWNAGTER